MKIDKKPRKVMLTLQEIQFIIEALEYQPHNIYDFLNYDKIVNKLKKIKNGNR